MPATHTENRLKSRDDLSLFYRDYGATNDGMPIVCMPGITRNSRDFEDLADYLSATYRVLTVDFRGRGFSDHDPDWRNYHPATYVADMIELLDHAQLRQVILLGTSLGGLVATILAKRHSDRIAAAIINDIGPEIGAAGLERIKSYIGRAPAVQSWDDAIVQARETYGHALPGLSQAMWQRLVRRSYRADQNGVPQLDMDPKIGDAARKVGAGLDDPWELFAGFANKPLLLIQGGLSDILTDDIVARMFEKKPDMQHVRVANRGHPPLLDEPECIEAIDTFIRSVNDN